jgi:putative tryptophan/tyrosine transport system substrate-binding protein
MKRRNFITLLGSAAAAWPQVAQAQQAAMPVIGLLDPRSPDAIRERLRAYRQGLKDNGYVEGDNVTIVYRWAENQFDRLPELVAELVRRQVAVIATAGENVAPVAKAATTMIPIVFIASQDPVKLGLVASLARPGGNVTGVNFFSTELVAKRLEHLRALVPGAARVALLVNPSNPATTDSTVREAESAARALGPQIYILNASTGPEVNAAFATLVRERQDALIVSSDPFFSSRKVQLVNLTVRHAIPAAFTNREFAEIGGPDELWDQHFGCLAPGRRLCRSHPQRRQAGGLACGSVEQVRTGHQRRDRTDA